MAAHVDLEHLYFGISSDPYVSGPNCNACGVDLGPWGDKKARHISFHEGLKAPTAQTNEPIWTMTETEFNRELATAWHRGQRAAIAWQHKRDKGEEPLGPTCPYGQLGPMEGCGE